MTAREFAEKYDFQLEKVLCALTEYVGGGVDYLEFPDAELPESFTEAMDEPGEFSDFLLEREM